jgi:CRP-like cAMP-binding protein
MVIVENYDMKILELENSTATVDQIIRRQLLPKFDMGVWNFSDDFIRSLVYNSRLEFYHKNERLGKPGNCNDQLYYINRGIAQTFYHDRKGDKSVVTNIWKKNDTIFDLNSFLNGVDENEINEMLEDGEVISVSFTALKKLLETFPNMVGFLLMLQAEREKKYKYYQHLLRLNVSQKVIIFLNDHPAMVNRINNKIIAAYLGVSRSRFSKAYSYIEEEINAIIKIT